MSEDLTNAERLREGLAPVAVSAVPMARLERYASTDPVRDVAVQLAFERPAHDLVVLLDGGLVRTAVTGTNVVVRVPDRAGVRSLEVGVRQGDGRVRLVHRVELIVRDGVLELR